MSTFGDFMIDEATKLRAENLRLRQALQAICDSKECPWTAAAMFRIAEAALKGSPAQRVSKDDHGT